MSIPGAVIYCTMSIERRWVQISGRLAEAVDRAFSSRSEFAERIGSDTSTVSLWLSGKRTPRLETFLEAAALTGVPLSALLGEAAREVHVPQLVTIADSPSWCGFPLIAEDVAAGLATWPDDISPEDIPIIPVPKEFAHIFDPKETLLDRQPRYLFIRLGSQADSMEPMIQRGSLVLIDRGESARVTVINRIMSASRSNQPMIPALCVTGMGGNGDDMAAIKCPQIAKLREGEAGESVIAAFNLMSANLAYSPIYVDVEMDEWPTNVVRGKVLLWVAKPNENGE